MANMSPKKNPIPEQDPNVRNKNFEEVALGYTVEMAVDEANRCLNCPRPACMSGCPVNVKIPQFIARVREQDFKGAYHKILEDSSLPAICGRVCPQEKQCESKCVRGIKGEPVGIGRLERFVADWNRENADEMPEKIATNGHRVAVIGSGPSGLAAADQLNKRGHNVTMFEREDRVGGLLMYGIPNMKLEKQIIDRKINVMKEEGVTFVTSANVGKNYKAAKLLKEFDSVVLACGASNPRDINVPGRDAEGIYFAVDFLKSTTKSLLNSNLEDGNYISAKDKHVIVIGGGDTGNDCVGTAIRHGCASVSQLEMMPKLPEKRTENNSWPEWPRVLKTDYGQEEAIAVFGHDPRIYQTTVKEFVKDESGKLVKAILISLKAEKNPETGRMSMVPVEGSEKEVPADLVLIAAGFLGAQSYVADAFGVELNARTNVATEAGKYATNVEKVFTAGDMHRGQSLVVWAIHEGRNVAKEVDKYLMGYTNLA